ncbi:unnamed protein product [Cylicocyclus nassatus]|uniref:Uncharacterized protein n=1 Tax=Cylicocyclus nassatus TaxID=53992 RepID=A0AA36GWH1_CYLNA|nr:unnamed protein product [Cylicocyclus nassatus]
MSRCSRNALSHPPCVRNEPEATTLSAPVGSPGKQRGRAEYLRSRWQDYSGDSQDDGTNGELGIGISTCESENDITRELMEVRGRVPMANPQDEQTDTQLGNTTDSNGTSRQH